MTSHDAKDRASEYDAYSDPGLTCQGCGCTNERACPGGCYWASVDPPTCSNCHLTTTA